MQCRTYYSYDLDVLKFLFTCVFSNAAMYDVCVGTGMERLKIIILHMHRHYISTQFVVRSRSLYTVVAADKLLQSSFLNLLDKAADSPQFTA